MPATVYRLDAAAAIGPPVLALSYRGRLKEREDPLLALTRQLARVEAMQAEIAVRLSALERPWWRRWWAVICRAARRLGIS